jgi:hypothetical protein
VGYPPLGCGKSKRVNGVFFPHGKKNILVGGDWNHGILLLSHHIGNRKIIPTDELHHSSAG